MKLMELNVTKAIVTFIMFLSGFSMTIFRMSTSMESFVKQLAIENIICTAKTNF